MRRWRPYDKLSATEQAHLARCGLSSAAIEVCCVPGRSSIGVVRESGSRFHWACFDVSVECRDEGFEDSREEARRAAAEAMRLWAHRCASAGKNQCLGYCSIDPAGRSKTTGSGAQWGHFG